MMDNEDSTECDAEHLLMAEEIKKDPVRLAAAQKYLEGKKEDISSIQDLRDKVKDNNDEETNDDPMDVGEENAEDVPPPELMTEEDKASIQKMQHYNKKNKEMMGDASRETKVG